MWLSFRKKKVEVWACSLLTFCSTIFVSWFFLYLLELALISCSSLVGKISKGYVVLLVLELWVVSDLVKLSCAVLKLSSGCQLQSSLWHLGTVVTKMNVPSWCVCPSVCQLPSFELLWSRTGIRKWRVVQSAGSGACRRICESSLPALVALFCLKQLIINYGFLYY